MASLSDPEVREFLQHGTRTGKVAFVAADGSPMVTPVWFVLEGDELVFNTGKTTSKGKAFLRDGRVAVVVDGEAPPYPSVQLRGFVTLSEDPDELLRTATEIGGRYMGADRAEEFGKRNGVPGELVVRLRPSKVIAHFNATA
ncbi:MULTISPECIES: PPOX class F420-dependent oxidoreductase [Nocardia]|uniref:F420-dependent protein n=2 Tax=Nocardia TaxID=1817 RepID=A0ABR4ZEA4_9NOCA|nr:MULTISPECIES: PPOX class F420-dependent oxidoreductase [Nocardia]AFU05531.1 putative pyridoxamine 5'-phosphate oxidase-related, FMN-binding protein [Nocardia brasiliensis ATCC 700358]KIA63334.1 F420-dependent protein [Nocardia vulneris]MBF6124623.1 PPOX class F420-dependent oxidoreductase [Nocardia brasiliensis]MBF6546146.1 PPOX class F420-dependent oxidoreductase [Nocardia brasiliensis]OCF86203.1 F420-dependent protein [Nocardia brasiliensis]